jgi:hypothetical protein
LIDTEISERRSVDLSDPEIAGAERHRRAVICPDIVRTWLRFCGVAQGLV